MVDIALLRSSPEKVREILSKRNENPDVVDSLLELDLRWRTAVQKLEALQAERNNLSKTKQSAEQHRFRLTKLKEMIERAQVEARDLQHQLNDGVSRLPNLLAPDVPIGKDSASNKILATKGKITIKNGRPHEEIMSSQGWLDLETAAKASGARYRYLIGEAARAHRQLFAEAISFAESKGFTYVVPPVVSRAETLLATGFFPRGIEDTFQIGDDQYLVGTSEPMLLMLAANKTFDRANLPKRFVGYSSCFRKEAGSYGRDVRGMFRMHQFDKVELVSICHPDDSEKEHELIVAMQEEFVSRFNLPYQKVLLSSGEQSHIAMKQIDIEIWFPSQNQYRETHSASNCGDFQARFLRIKVSDDPSAVLAHTLNGTLATERLLLAIIENRQKKDGTIDLPDELK
jgi:seryl-tRNA synthetase